MIEVLKLGRQQGKTTRCILELCRDENCCLIVPHRRTRDNLRREYPSLKYRIFDASTVNYVPGHQYCVDDFDMMYCLPNVPLCAIKILTINS